MFGKRKSRKGQGDEALSQAPAPAPAPTLVNMAGIKARKMQQQETKNASTKN